MTKPVNFVQLKTELAIERVAEFLGLHLKKKGDKQFKTDCPVKGTRDALIITPDYPNKDGTRGAFYCFSCNQGGDAIQLAAKVNKCEIKEAAEFLLTLTNAPVATAPQRDFSKVVEYLQPTHPLLDAVGVTPEACKHFSCGYKPKGLFSGRLAIPVHGPDGEMLGYCGRALKPKQEPLLAWPTDLDGDELIFNQAALKPGIVYCTDDPLKVIVAFTHGIEAIATYGPPSAKTLKLLAELMAKHGVEAITNL